LLYSSIALACFVEPYTTISRWWGGLLSLPNGRVDAIGTTTTYLKQFPAEQNRVYTRAELFAEEFTSTPRLDAPNLHARFGLHNVAGMEPLILDRYSRALGGVGPDSVTPRPGFPANDFLFQAKSHVLDILNTTHVVSFANLEKFSDPLTYRDGVGVSVFDLKIDLPPGGIASLTGSDLRPADELILVTSLANSVEVPQGAEVGQVRLQTEDGHSFAATLKAGIDSAEWAYDRPDVKQAIKHQRGQVFDSRPADPNNTFSANHYWTRIPLGTSQRFTSIEMRNTSQTASLALWRATLFSSQANHSTILSPRTHSANWTIVYDEDQVQILQNSRALPRAWLVAAAQSVDGEEALQRIQGNSAVDFNPAKTVLLEVAPNQLPTLPQSDVPAGTEARVVEYEASRIAVNTKSTASTVLVLSEIFYPGWEATVDGQKTPIFLADYLLRGIAVPPGEHRVEMRYRAPAARVGALVSAFTVVLLVGLAFYSRRTLHDTRQQDNTGQEHK
jgi:hypothetical protein